MKTHGLHKSERLKSRSSILALLRDGRRSYIFPVKMLWRYTEQPGPYARMTVVVPKRLIRSAVRRNLIKRRVREAYRMNKHTLVAHLQEKDKKIEMLFLFQSEKVVEYKQIESSIKEHLSVLLSR